MKTFVYVADQANPSNTRGIKIGYVRGYNAETMNLFDPADTILIYVAPEIVLGELIWKLENFWLQQVQEEGKVKPLIECRIETEQFPIPEAEEKKE